MKTCLMILAILIAVPAAGARAADLVTVPHVDVSRYLGTWYQIARNPLMFEGECVCAQQKLGLAADGNVSVYNSCNRGTVTGPIAEIRGEAVNDDTSTNAHFTVDFGLPHKGQYWIIGLDADYRYAVVSDPSRLSLYILSKTPTLAPDLYQAAVAQAAAQVPTNKLQLEPQTGCTYP